MKIPFFLAIIICIASFLRLYHLSSVPPSSSLDEASIGYNAYSILKTGKDEFGITFPLVLRAYDDYRPALYVYLVIPFVKILGLTILAVRLPSAILSILTVLMTYFLTKYLLYLRENNNSEKIALVASFLLAISPWHIYISRLSHEVNAGLAFFILASFFFFRKNLFLTTLFFVFSFMSYQSEKIVIPIFFIGLCLIFKNEIYSAKKSILLALIATSFVLVPFLTQTFSTNALIRFKATNTFESQNKRFEEQALRLEKEIRNKNSLARIYLNRRILAAQIVFEGYVSHFNPYWLFFNNTNEKHKVPNIGLFYIWELPLIIIGIVVLFLKKYTGRVKLFIFIWIFTAPLAASLTTDAPHAMRTYTFLPMWQILSSLGVYSLFNVCGRRNYGKLASIFISVIVLSVSLLILYKNYFFTFPKTQSSSFQYALAKSIPIVQKTQDSYNKIIISNKDNLYQSYMFFLFYSSYDPAKYQRYGGTKSGGYEEAHEFGKYEFRPVDLNKENIRGSTLYVLNASEVPGGMRALKTFSNLDEKEVIKIISVSKQ